MAIQICVVVLCAVVIVIFFILLHQNEQACYACSPAVTAGPHRMMKIVYMMERRRGGETYSIWLK